MQGFWYCICELEGTSSVQRAVLERQHLSNIVIDIKS